MIANNHYDDKELLQLLRRRMGDGDDLALAHVESCTTCQAKLETISQSGMTWDEVSDLLRPDGTSPVAELAKSFGPDEDDPKVLASTTSFLEPSDHPDSLGRFARYEIMELLGRGGMGIVMRGFDTSLNRHSAIKVLAPELATCAAARKRFSREARSAAAVVHPHVVPIQTVDEHNGLPYLVMPVVEGQSLQQRVQQNGPLSVIETVRIAAQVASGLQAAHEQGLVHRDIKPANVLLENGVERVQITDFGLARAIDDASMTRSGVITGTPQYMSPEQAHGDTIDHRSDLFSLGSLIYFMLAARSPFRAETTMGVLNRIGHDEPRSLRSINAEVPQWLEQIVMKLLSKSPAGRFQTAAAVGELLQDWHAHLQQPDIVPRPTEPTALAAGSSTATPMASRSGLTKWMIATAAFAFFAFAGVLIVLETNKGTLTIESDADDVPIRIMQGDKLVDKLTVTKGVKSVRVAAGAYVVEIDGEFDGLAISDGSVSLSRRGTATVMVITTGTGRRSDPLGSAASSLQGDWEFLSVEKEGAVTEYKPEHRLTLSISGDNWTVGDQVKHRVDIADSDLVFHGTSEFPGFGRNSSEATIALGIFELKDESLAYCMTNAFVESNVASGSFPVNRPKNFDTEGTENVVFRLRRKAAIRKTREASNELPNFMLSEAAENVPGTIERDPSEKASDTSDQIPSRTPRENRWMVDFKNTQNLDKYASQLDFFNIELGCVFNDGRIFYVKNLAGTPVVREALSTNEQRLFLSNAGEIFTLDLELLVKAGIPDPSMGTVLHFYDSETQKLLDKAESEYMQKPVEQIRRTWFQVRHTGSGYEFFVAKQELREAKNAYDTIFDNPQAHGAADATAESSSVLADSKSSIPSAENAGNETTTRLWNQYGVTPSPVTDTTARILEWMGLHLAPIDHSQFRGENLAVKYLGGMDVTFVRVHGPAEKAGFNDVDIVVTLQGTGMSELPHLDHAIQEMCRNAKHGEAAMLCFEVLRSGKIAEVQVSVPESLWNDSSLAIPPRSE